MPEISFYTVESLDTQKEMNK